MFFITKTTWPVVTATAAAVILLLTCLALFVGYKIRKENETNYRPDRVQTWGAIVLTSITVIIAWMQLTGFEAGTPIVRQMQQWIAFLTGIVLVVFGLYCFIYLPFKKGIGRLRGLVYINAGSLMLITAAKVAMGLGIGEVNGIIRDMAVWANIALPVAYMPFVSIGTVLTALIIGIYRLVQFIKEWYQKRKAAKLAKQQTAAGQANASQNNAAQPPGAATAGGSGRATVPGTTPSATSTPASPGTTRTAPTGPSRSVQRRMTRRPTGANPTSGNPAPSAPPAPGNNGPTTP